MTTSPSSRPNCVWPARRNSTPGQRESASYPRMRVWCFPYPNTTLRRGFVEIVESHTLRIRTFLICWVTRSRTGSVCRRNCLRRSSCGILFTRCYRQPVRTTRRGGKWAIFGLIMFSLTKMDRFRSPVSTHGLVNRTTTPRPSTRSRSHTCPHSR